MGNDLKIFKSLADWRHYRKSIDPTKTIGFVPTMGNLHAGHASLLQNSIAENDITFLSIYINPKQFNNPEDLEKYPRTEKEDFALAESLGVNAILFPSYDEIYSDDYNYQVLEKSLSKIMEGTHRPGHFDGVLTIVLKLLNLAQAHRAYFGEKDYQQFQLIKGMCDAFFIDTEIIPCPTIRNDQGLALSSRNSRLTPNGLQKATQFAKQLQSPQSIENIVSNLESQGFQVDYIQDHNSRRYGAVFLENIRLIDNIPLR